MLLYETLCSDDMSYADDSALMPWRLYAQRDALLMRDADAKMFYAPAAEMMSFSVAACAAYACFAAAFILCLRQYILPRKIPLMRAASLRTDARATPPAGSAPPCAGATRHATIEARLSYAAACHSDTPVMLLAIIRAPPLCC